MEKYGKWHVCHIYKYYICHIVPSPPEFLVKSLRPSACIDELHHHRGMFSVDVLACGVGHFIAVSHIHPVTLAVDHLQLPDLQPGGWPWPLRGTKPHQVIFFPVCAYNIYNHIFA